MPDGPWTKYQTAVKPWEKYGGSDQSQPTAPQGQPEAETEFGPAEKTPVPNPLVEGDPNLSMKDVGQFARGAVSGVLGVPGDIEAMGMRALSKVGLGDYKAKQIARGEKQQQTFFPTSDTVSKKLFSPPPDQRASGYRELGNIVGSTLAPGAVGKARKVIYSIPRIASEIAPGATARAVERLSKIGQSETPSVLGANIHDTLMKKFQQAGQSRSGEAAQNFADFTGHSESTEPILKDYRDHLVETMKTKDKDLSGDEKKLIAQSASELRGDKSLEAIDKERRRLNEIAQSGPMEGHSAIKKKQASALADKLTSIMGQHNPAFDKYLSDYKKASEPINLYNQTALGRATTKGLPNLPATDAALLPSRFFKTEQSVKTLKALAKDDDFVDAAARIHTANEMQRLTTGKTIKAAALASRVWLRKNESWISQVPSVQKDAEKYVSGLESTAKTQKVARYAAGAGAVGILLSEGQRPYFWIRHLLGIP